MTPSLFLFKASAYRRSEVFDDYLVKRITPS